MMSSDIIRTLRLESRPLPVHRLDKVSLTLVPHFSRVINLFNSTRAASKPPGRTYEIFEIPHYIIIIRLTAVSPHLHHLP